MIQSLTTPKWAPIIVLSLSNWHCQTLKNRLKRRFKKKWSVKFSQKVKKAKGLIYKRIRRGKREKRQRRRGVVRLSRHRARKIELGVRCKIARLILLAPIERKIGRNWSQRLLAQLKKMRSQPFSNPCLPTWTKWCNNLNVHQSNSMPYRFKSKRMLPCFSPEEESWAMLRVKRHFSRFATSARTSEAGTSQPRNLRSLESQGPTVKILNRTGKNHLQMNQKKWRNLASRWENWSRKSENLIRQTKNRAEKILSSLIFKNLKSKAISEAAEEEKTFRISCKND